MITIWGRVKNLWKLSEWEPAGYPMPEMVDKTIISPLMKIPTAKPTWFAHDPEGSVITPDHSDLFDKTDTLKDLLGEE